MDNLLSPNPIFFCLSFSFTNLCFTFIFVTPFSILFLCLYAFCRVFVYIFFFFFVFFVSIDALDGLLDHLVRIIQPENLLIGNGSHENLFPQTGIMIFKHWKFQTLRICDKLNDWISYLLKSLAAKKAA